MPARTTPAAITNRNTSSDMGKIFPRIELLSAGFNRGLRSHGLPVGLFSGSHCVGEAVLLLADHVLAFLDQIAGRVLDLGSPLLDEILALAGLGFDQLPGLAAGLRREQHADADTDAQPEQEVCEAISFHLSIPPVSMTSLSTEDLASVYSEVLVEPFFYGTISANFYTIRQRNPNPCGSEDRRGWTARGCGNTRCGCWRGGRTRRESCGRNCGEERSGWRTWKPRWRG